MCEKSQRNLRFDCLARMFERRERPAEEGQRGAKKRLRRETRLLARARTE
jgi:hypothetical protein